MSLRTQTEVYSVVREYQPDGKWVVRQLKVDDMIEFCFAQGAPVFHTYQNNELARAMLDTKGDRLSMGRCKAWYEWKSKGYIVTGDREPGMTLDESASLQANKKCSELNLKDEKTGRLKTDAISLAQYRQRIIDEVESESESAALARERKHLIKDLMRENNYDKMHHFC